MSRLNVMIALRGREHMPPPVVKTVQDLIFWEYAKLIAESAVGDRKNWGFVMHTFKQLKSGKLQWSSTLREWEKEHQLGCRCAYCGCTSALQKDHIIPRCRGGMDHPDNVVWACEKCNQEKGDRDPFEWYTARYGLEEGKYLVPRIVMGKYLKLVYELHKEKGTLQAHDLTGDGLLNVLDLGAIATKGHKKS
ncbi:MAG: HNH endonuclease [Candidatus Caldarchaeum sp.]